MALPIASLLSPSLKQLDSKPYYRDLRSLLSDFFQRNTEKSPALFVATHSTMVSLPPEILGTIQREQEMETVVVRLSELESEKKLTQILHSHINMENLNHRKNREIGIVGRRIGGEEAKSQEEEEEEKDRLLVVQFDPISSSSMQINHAIFICTRELSKRETEPSKKRPILFLVHIPPGVRNRTRSFFLDFQPHWHFFFVDELRASNQRDIERTVGAPIIELCESGEV